VKIAVIGYGQVGRTLGLGWASRAHTVVFGARDLERAEVSEFRRTWPAAVVRPMEEAIAEAELVCLAVPYPAALSLREAAALMEGKIVVDCTNPIGPGLTLAVGHDTSGAEEIAKGLPGARVVKAFNTTGWENMADAWYPGYGNLRPLMPVCGDDESANKAVCGLAEDLGFEAWNWGPLSGARYLEALAMLWIIPARKHGQGAGFALALLRR
jgi:8-hydroxy-5-deazaflavin:NADPH oxidoreductase